MTIDKTNIEAFLYDYAEGNLSQTERQSVESYIELHPQYKTMLELYCKNISVAPDENIIYEDKESLYNNIISNSLNNEILLKKKSKNAKYITASRYLKYVSGAVATILLCVGIITYFNYVTNRDFDAENPQTVLSDGDNIQTNNNNNNVLPAENNITVSNHTVKYKNKSINNKTVNTIGDIAPADTDNNKPNDGIIAVSNCITELTAENNPPISTDDNDNSTDDNDVNKTNTVVTAKRTSDNTTEHIVVTNKTDNQGYKQIFNTNLNTGNLIATTNHYVRNLQTKTKDFINSNISKLSFKRKVKQTETTYRNYASNKPTNV